MGRLLRRTMPERIESLEDLAEPTSKQGVDIAMARQAIIALYIVAMVAVIIGADFAFFRNRFLERLIANIGIVLLFAAFYMRFFGRPWLP